MVFIDFLFCFLTLSGSSLEEFLTRCMTIRPTMTANVVDLKNNSTKNVVRYFHYSDLRCHITINRQSAYRSFLTLNTGINTYVIICWLTHH